MIAVTPPVIFSKGGSPKQATPLTAPATLLPEIISEQIFGDEGWMKI
jgi:hypothetical protein